MWHQAIFRSIVRSPPLLVRVSLPHSGQRLPLTLPHRTIFTRYSRRDRFITRCLTSSSPFSPLLFFFLLAVVCFASLFLTRWTCLTRDADWDVALTRQTREGGAETQRKPLPPLKKGNISPVTHSRVAQRRRKNPVGNVSENTICLVLIPRLFAGSSLPRPFPWKRNTPTRLSEQKGEELHINLTSLSGQAETSHTERRPRGDAHWLHALKLCSAQGRDGRAAIKFSINHFLLLLFFSFLLLKWLHKIRSSLPYGPVWRPSLSQQWWLYVPHKMGTIAQELLLNIREQAAPQTCRSQSQTHTQNTSAHKTLQHTNGSQLQQLISLSGTMAYHSNTVYI